MNRRKLIIVSIIGIFLTLVIMIGLTYAYYLTQISDNTSTKSISVTTQYLSLLYGDGNAEIVATNIFPGEDIASKTFTVTNTGNALVEDYVVVLEDVINNFVLREDIVYTLNCVSVNKNTGNVSGTCKGVSTETPFPRNNSVIVTNDIARNIRHEYTLTVHFKETDTDQSIDMNKILSAKVNIANSNEYVTYLTETEDVKNYISDIKVTENLADAYISGTTTAMTTSNTVSKPEIQFLADSTYLKGKKNWLVFSSISKLKYNSSSWTEVAGPVDSNFTKYLSDNNFDINKFKDMKYRATDDGEYASVVHFAAALAAHLYNTDSIVNLFGYEEDEFNNLAGWAGDLQTLINNNLLKQISNQSDYQEVYNKMSELIGKSGTYFDSDDLYADIDAINIYRIMSSSKTIESVLNTYFSSRYKNRFYYFISALTSDNSYDEFNSVILKYTEYSSYWELLEKSYSKTVGRAAADAFTDYIWYAAHLKELNIFTESLSFKKGDMIKFKAEFINDEDKLENSLTSSDYTWTVTKKDGTSCLSTINNGVLNISNSETAKELVINITLNKSNKVKASRIITIK